MSNFKLFEVLCLVPGLELPGTRHKIFQRLKILQNRKINISGIGVIIELRTIETFPPAQ
jgi:hypothetical protein